MSLPALARLASALFLLSHLSPTLSFPPPFLPSLPSAPSPLLARPPSRFLRTLSSLLPSKNRTSPAVPAAEYERAEDWDKTAGARVDKGWEERVRFDAQREGNQGRQNDVLRKALDGDGK
ncbi:hypothetical protein TeGR_g4356 [Tetraparma gracilis]|uniref:Uncharacterized protein n=1 Tax=Tetraparma gracilis TaxID=2962635 RepID=A0ABQ6M5D8_9STRA|nr:hypothetical protein TeGR_g4356 [Tetraparma gracilis]